MPSGKEDTDAESGIFTYDGTYLSHAQNTTTSAASASYAARLAAEEERVAREFDMPPLSGVYGYPHHSGPDSSIGEGGLEDGTASSLAEESQLVSTFSGVYENDDHSLVRNINADILQAKDEEGGSGSRKSGAGRANSQGDDDRTPPSIAELYGGYTITQKSRSGGAKNTASPDGSTENANTTNRGSGLMDGLMRTMATIGLAWNATSATDPSTPTTEKANSPTGSAEEEDNDFAGAEISVDGSISMLSFEGREVNSTASASRAPFFKGRRSTAQKEYPPYAATARASSKRGDRSPSRKSFFTPKRLICGCSIVVVLAVGLAIGGWLAMSQGEDDERASPVNPIGNGSGSGGTDNEDLSATVPPTVAPSVAACGEDSMTAIFQINGDLYDCIWFAQRTTAYREVMCETRADIRDVCRETCTGKCAPSSSPEDPTEDADAPTLSPSVATNPTVRPTTASVPPPTVFPSAAPVLTTAAPSTAPTSAPISAPTSAPISAPTFAPTSAPVAATQAPTETPPEPTAAPVVTATSIPTFGPSLFVPPTAAPVASPTSEPTTEPSSLDCPPDEEGDIPGSSTSCEQFAQFNPNFQAQRCQPPWPVFTWCWTTCGNCAQVGLEDNDSP